MGDDEHIWRDGDGSDVRMEDLAQGKRGLGSTHVDFFLECDYFLYACWLLLARGPARTPSSSRQPKGTETALGQAKNRAGVRHLLGGGGGKGE